MRGFDSCKTGESAQRQGETATRPDGTAVSFAEIAVIDRDTGETLSGVVEVDAVAGTALVYDGLGYLMPITGRFELRLKP